MPFEHAPGVRSEVLKFRVRVGCEELVAFISHATCRADAATAAPLQALADFYERHRPTLEAIVAQRRRAGARSPMVLRAQDLQHYAALRC